MGTFEELCALFDGRGGERYGEAVSKRDHALLTAAAARAAGHAPSLVLAGLLHDVGHLLGEVDDWAGVHDHAELGGDWVEARFGPGVSGPVRLHVEAKRYLCGVEPGYAEGLSPASQHTLTHQGGPMDGDEQRVFESREGWQEAVLLRRLEDGLGKSSGVSVDSLEDYRSLVEELGS